ncbi:HCLS1-binding protein 3-like [Uloborus diversus]|uniref:HCLS1-binding protein 3-like n=1 Tax=Uloborus diversus TaxID=327109 RepID=UPI002409B168|nr:HCLS1-binding protein 3-like [Uloborus diversus]
MTTPSVILKTLKNEETGIDISVPRFEEEEAPLGGISILYEISILTKIDLFKTSLHKSEDVVHFSIFKAYREIEEFVNKLKKKFPGISLPAIPKYSLAENYTDQEKLQALNEFMEDLSKNREICVSPIFTQFIRINPNQLTSLKSCTTSDITQNFESGTEKDIFLKMKKKTDSEDKQSFLQSSVPSEINDDLFQSKLKEKTANGTISMKQNLSAGLFDEFDDDNLFSTSTAKTVSSNRKKVEKNHEVRSTKIEPRKKPEVGKTLDVDDSQIIIKDRKQGDLSLFDEQDFGDYITKEEESLFLVTPNIKEGKRNTLLLLSDDTPSSKTDSSSQENLDDLLNLEPLPESPSANKKFLEMEFEKEVKEESLQSPPSKVASVEDEKPEKPLPSKPVPLPRKKSLGKVDTEAIPKPEVMPRKVFLDKPQVPSKPAPPPVATRSKAPPPVQAKPTLAPKPKPPPLRPKPGNLVKSKDAKALDVANANDSETNSSNLNSGSDLTNDLNQFDILKYIEQEEKILESEASLFD